MISRLLPSSLWCACLVCSGCSEPKSSVSSDGPDASIDAAGADATPDAPAMDAGLPDAAPASACASDQTVCDGVCRATRWDETSCGDCSTRCEDGEVCDQGACIASAVAPPCDATKEQEALEPASKDAPTVELDCSLTLPPGAVVTKKVRIEGARASGVTLDCQDATIRETVAAGGQDTIVIGSEKVSDDTWERPTDVTVRDCRIEGSIRIKGMGANGQAPDVTTDSQTAGHRERAQRAAPTRVLLERLTIVGDSRIPLYLAPGATEVTFQDSEIVGSSSSTVIYLDAESARNRIVRNRFDASPGALPPREVFAVDGSADNLIASNELHHLRNGGIYIYRNCGEGGAVRHQEPRRNVVAGNVFHYQDENGWNPSVWVGSRNESELFPILFCDLDKGHPFGSSVSDLDFARDTVVAENQISVFEPEDMIRVHDSPTYLIDNEKVSAGDPRPAGCTIFRDGEPPDYVRHGAAYGARLCTEGRLE